MEKLPVEILQQVCELVSTAPADAVNRSGFPRKPIYSLSKTNKVLRELCFPHLFRKIAIYGSLEDASERMRAIETNRNAIASIRLHLA